MRTTKNSIQLRWEDIPEEIEAVALTLLQAIKERDPYTYGHCRRVGRNACLLAKAAGLNEAEQRILEFSGLFHDLGKIGIPDHILLKPGRLTPEEEMIMKQHPEKSAQILAPLTSTPFFRSLIPGVLHHHERMDGKGYPHGISGENIPLTARILLVVDTFDAITTTRPYRGGKAEEFAYKELKQFSGRQFDSQLVQIFLKAHPKWEDFDPEIQEQQIAVASLRKAA